MRSLVLQEFLSLDGFGADAHGGVDFIPASGQGDRSFMQHQLDFMDEIDGIVLGRVTYEMFVEYWPQAKSGDDKELAEKINAARKYVFSSSLEQAPWGAWDNATVVRGDASAEIQALKQRGGKNLVIWGSLSLARTLADAGAIDRYQLVICPVVLGNGRRLFHDEIPAGQLTLAGIQSFDRGNVLLDYTRKAAMV